VAIGASDEEGEMGATFDDLRILKLAEELADEIWVRVARWNDFPKDVVGKQLARAVDSIGANIAESYGRFHFGEKLQFLYYARGSIFESRYWINRAAARGLLGEADSKSFLDKLTVLAKQLNSFAAGLKSARKS
jgi:four helix bundle protein